MHGYNTHPLDLGETNQKYGRMAQQMEERHRRIIQEIEEEWGPGRARARGNYAAVLSLYLMGFALISMMGASLLGFTEYKTTGTVVLLTGLGLFFVACKLGIHIPAVKGIYQTQLENENDLYQRTAKSHTTLWHQALDNRKRCDEELREEWRDFKNGKGGYDLYIREEGTDAPSVHWMKQSYDAYVSYLYELVFDDVIFQQVANAWKDREPVTEIDRYIKHDRMTPKRVNASRWTSWQGRRQRDRNAGLPTSILEEEQQLDQARIERAQEVFSKAEDSGTDAELAEFLGSRELDTGRLCTPSSS